MKKHSGILLPIYSLPSDYQIGDFGPEAYRFIDLLKESGQTIWSILPLNPLGFGNSPYKSPSIFAGNPYFISLELLVQEGLLEFKDIQSFKKKSGKIDYSSLSEERLNVLKLAFKNLIKPVKKFEKFSKENAYWLADFSFFMAIKMYYKNVNWNEWPEKLRKRDSRTLKKYQIFLKEEIEFWQFLQFKFFEQWHALRTYAHKQGIKIMGDLPYYVDFDSSDVWVHRNLFYLTKDKIHIDLLSGVPGGDEFSHKDRVWGHPCYRWEEHKKTKYIWFLERFKQAGRLYDILRFDHALGLIRFYGIKEKNHEFCGKWFEGPCAHETKFIDLVKKTIPRTLRIVVEDLGTQTRYANQLFQEIGWNSMRVFQFAATGKYGLNNTHLPHYYYYKTIAYSSTHDNPTMAGFISEHHSSEFAFIKGYLNVKEKEDLRWAFLRSISETKSEFVIYPVQDILGLDNSTRHSFGEDFHKSWQWKLKDLTALNKYKNKLKKLSIQNNRYPQEVQNESI